ncbi:hypothetical protein HN51_065696 [Arachis hypogaea]
MAHGQTGLGRDTPKAAPSFFSMTLSRPSAWYQLPPPASTKGYIDRTFKPAVLFFHSRRSPLLLSGCLSLCLCSLLLFRHQLHWLLAFKSRFRRPSSSALN